MNRDIEYEHKLYEIEESPEINGYILLYLLKELGECNIEQLAISFYLYRFTNVLDVILYNTKLEPEYIYEFSQQDMFNLDTVLMPFLTSKYNERFKKGIIQLLSRSLININENKITIKQTKFESLTKKLEKENSMIIIKTKLIKKVIENFETSELNKIIIKIVGE